MKVELILPVVDDAKGMHPVIRRRLHIQSSKVNGNQDTEHKDIVAGGVIVLSYTFPQGVYPVRDSFQSLHAHIVRTISEKTTSSLIVQFHADFKDDSRVQGDQYIDYFFAVDLKYFTAICAQYCASSDGTCDACNGRRSIGLLDSLMSTFTGDTFVQHVLDEPAIYRCERPLFDASVEYTLNNCVLVGSGSAVKYALHIPIGSVTQQPIVAMGTNLCVLITLFVLLLTFSIPKARGNKRSY